MIEYKISSFCSYGACVEVGQTPDGRVAMRDAKDRDGAVLTFVVSDWSEFVVRVKSGDLDLA